MRHRQRWFLICDHPTCPAAYVFGPFRNKAAAWRYPNTFMGFVDAPAFRGTMLRVERDDKKRGRELWTSIPRGRL